MKYTLDSHPPFSPIDFSFLLFQENTKFPLDRHIPLTIAPDFLQLLLMMSFLHCFPVPLRYQVV
jgi:hypothetical protein